MRCSVKLEYIHNVNIPSCWLSLLNAKAVSDDKDKGGVPQSVTTELPQRTNI